MLSPASKWVPGFTRSGTGQHFHHALRAYTVYASAHIWDGWVLPKVSPALQGGAGQPQLLKLPPHLIPSLVMSRRDWRPQKQQTADSPPCSGCCPWPPLSPRLSPAERLAFRQGREGSGGYGLLSSAENGLESKACHSLPHTEALDGCSHPSPHLSSASSRLSITRLWCMGREEREDHRVRRGKSCNS